MAQENFLRAIVDFGDQPVSVSLYVEDCEPANRVSRGKHAFHVLSNGPPFRFLGYPVPDIDGAARKIAVRFRPASSSFFLLITCMG